MADIAALAARIADGSPPGAGPGLLRLLARCRSGTGSKARTGIAFDRRAQLGYQADLLIGAGCVASVESAAVTLGEFGPAPCFNRAIKDGSLDIKDSTCPVIHAGLQASEKGIPFMPLRGVIGSDLVAHRPDWQIIDNPYGDPNGDPQGDEDPILLVPRIQPDIALFHAAKADHQGNVWIGVRRELMLMAHAAKVTLVTVEEQTTTDLLSDDNTAAGTIPALYIEAVAPAPGGARPLGLRGCYPADAADLHDYARLAKTAEGFERYIDRLMALA